MKYKIFTTACLSLVALIALANKAYSSESEQSIGDSNNCPSEIIGDSNRIECHIYLPPDSSPPGSPEANQPTLSSFEGNWIGDGYECPYGAIHSELIRIEVNGNNLIATKLDSGEDICVPSGSLTFYGTIPGYVRRGSTFDVTSVTGLPDNPSSGTSTGQLTVFGPNMFTIRFSSGEHVVFQRDEATSSHTPSPIPFSGMNRLVNRAEDSQEFLSLQEPIEPAQIVRGCGRVVDLGINPNTQTPELLKLREDINDLFGDQAYDSLKPLSRVILGTSERQGSRIWVSVLAYQSVDPTHRDVSSTNLAWAAETNLGTPDSLRRTAAGLLSYPSGRLYENNRLNIVRYSCSTLFGNSVMEGEPLPTELPRGFRAPAQP